jgi:hypothetical protein
MNTNRLNPSTFVKFQTYKFQFENALNNDKLIELREIVKNGCSHFQNVYLSQKERKKRAKLTDLQINHDAYINEILELYEQYKNLLKDIENKINKPQQPETIKPKILKKTLLEFIHNVEKKEAFIQDLKITFPTEIGKSIKAIIDFLNEEQILIYGTKEFKQLFEELQNYFSRSIGSYNSVQNVKEIDKETNNTISKKLNPLIIKYKSK